MKKLIKSNKKQKLIYILDFVSALDLSAYHLSRNTNLTEAGILRILNGTVKNPHESTLNEIISYLDSIGTPTPQVISPSINNKDLCNIEIENKTESSSEIQEQINELKKIILVSKKINQSCDHHEEMLRLKEHHLKLLNVYEELTDKEDLE
ncbi:hypothetical protein V5J73_08755 [Flavobacterium sp. KS-LB2]|uniref:hypothetical protein n=1 Tax=Flavobacterium sp. KS-LB2 TaxID=3120525 RepID=UPI0030D1B070